MRACGFRQREVRGDRVEHTRELHRLRVLLAERHDVLDLEIDRSGDAHRAWLVSSSWIGSWIGINRSSGKITAREARANERVSHLPGVGTRFRMTRVVRPVRMLVLIWWDHREAFVPRHEDRTGGEHARVRGDRPSDSRRQAGSKPSRVARRGGPAGFRRRRASRANRRRCRTPSWMPTPAPPRAATPVVTVVEEPPSIKVNARGTSGLAEPAPQAAQHRSRSCL